MRSYIVLLSLIGISCAAVLGSDGGDLPPPVVPEPRQFDGDDLPTPVVPEPRQFDGGDLPPPVVPEPKQSSCQYSLAFTSVGQKAALTSPGYPNDYSPYSNCQYTVTSPAGTVIQMSCTEFNVESSTNCVYDVFSFSLTGDASFRDAGTACGRGTFSKNSTTNALTIKFKSDAGNPPSSFPYRFDCTLTPVANPNAAAAVVATTASPAITTRAPAITTRAPASTSSSTCSCGMRNEAARIVGGTQATLNEFPWRCNLYSPGKGVFCGATVISSQWILTAAHCTNAIPAGTTLYVDCADHDISSGNETTNALVRVSRIIQHADYDDSSQDNDISLLQLQTPLNFSRAIQPVCLPWNMVGQSVQGLSVTASGWGTISSGGSQSSVLKKVDLPVLTTAECQKYYGTSVTNNMICTYSPGSDTCQGDSGGSIDYKNPSNGRYYDLGIVSWGVGCAEKDHPGVYTQVTNYLNYIQTQTGDNSFCKA